MCADLPSAWSLADLLHEGSAQASQNHYWGPQDQGLVVLKALLA